jgi:cytoskeletal protein CcmA (bactofilin family)
MCHDELTMMMFADGELASAEREQIEAHVRGCRRCDALLTALRRERQVIVESLRACAVETSQGALPLGIPAEPLGWSAVSALARSARRWTAARPAQSVTTSTEFAFGAVQRSSSPRAWLAATVAMMIAVAVAVQFVVQTVQVTVAGVLPDWLNPLHAEGRVNLIVNTLVFLVEEGDRMTASLFTIAGLRAAAALMLLVSWTRLGGRPGALAGLVVFAVLATAAPAQALEIRRNENLTIPAGESIDDTLVAFGNSIDIDGTINGDLIAFARRVRVRGSVRGNVISFGQDVQVEGMVGGSILQFGQTVTTRGQAEGNLYAFGQTIDVPAGGRIGGNATVFSETARFEGAVARDVTSFGRALDISGTVSRRVNAYGAEIDIRAGARIEGDLTAHVESRDNVRVAPGATVLGTTRVEIGEPEPSRYLTAGYYIRQLLRLAAAFVTGWIVFRLVPRAAGIRIDTGAGWLTSLGVGAVAICATPILALVVGVTIIALPIAVFAILMWMTLLYLAKIFIAFLVGRMVLDSGSSRGRHVAPTLLVGLVLVIVAINLPFVGGLVNLLLTVTGFGVAVLEIARWYKGTARLPVSA